MRLTLAPATHPCAYVQVCPQPHGERVDLWSEYEAYGGRRRRRWTIRSVGGSERRSARDKRARQHCLSDGITIYGLTLGSPYQDNVPLPCRDFAKNIR